MSINIKYSRNGNFLVTMPCSALLRIENEDLTQLEEPSWRNEEYLEFANQTDDRILGTQHEKATLYDFNTGQVVNQFMSSEHDRLWLNNRATYHPDDSLILSGMYIKIPLHLLVHYIYLKAVYCGM